MDTMCLFTGRTNSQAPLGRAPLGTGRADGNGIVRVTGTSCPWTRRYFWHMPHTHKAL